MAESKEPKGSVPMASSLEEFRYMQQIYQNQYMALAQEINSRVEALRELDNAQKSIEDLDILKERKTLIPIGADTFIAGRITDENTVVLGIGAGYFVEKNIDHAKGYISKAIEKETQSINKLNKNKKEVESALMEIAYKVEELSH
ncbi:MAG: prefoldin subunit alpha [Candidatus Micrarchaeales archaeon]